MQKGKERQKTLLNIGEREKWFSVQNIDLRERYKKIGER
jgi:hypothetical protein